MEYLEMVYEYVRQHPNEMKTLHQWAREIRNEYPKHRLTARSIAQHFKVIRHTNMMPAQRITCPVRYCFASC